MDTQLKYRTVDTGLFMIANLFNILLIGIFLSRPLELKSLERVLGLVSVALALPVGFAVVMNALGKREWWTIVLPSLLVAFLIVELILDYILRLDFRSTHLLWPYLLLYYLSLMGMIGYAFGVSKTYGFITLATWYSYSKVGHG